MDQFYTSFFENWIPNTNWKFHNNLFDSELLGNRASSLNPTDLPSNRFPSKENLRIPMNAVSRSSDDVTIAMEENILLISKLDPDPIITIETNVRILCIYGYSLISKTRLDWTGLDRTGPDRSGPDRTGPDRTGPGRIGPDWTRKNWTGLKSLIYSVLLFPQVWFTINPYSANNKTTSTHRPHPGEPTDDPSHIYLFIFLNFHHTVQIVFNRENYIDITHKSAVQRHSNVDFILLSLLLCKL